MEMPSLFDSLQASPFAGDFKPEVLQQLATLGSWKYCRSGSIVFREGELNPFFYLIQSGHIALEMCLPARGCKRLMTLGPSDILAWSALLGEGKMTATAIALSDSELIQFPGSDLQQLCQSDNAFGFHLMQRVCQAMSQRLVATRLQLLDLYHQEATSGASYP